MTSRQFHILIVLAVVSGFLGGAVSNLLLRGAPAAAQTTGGKAQEVVIARKFVLVDGAGKTRATLGFDTAPGFAPAKSPGLALYDAAGKWRAELCLGPDGSPDLALYGTGGKWRTEGWDETSPRAIVCLGPDGSPGLTLNDGVGNARAIVACTTAEDKRTGTEIQAPGSTVTLFNADGHVMWKAP